MLYVFFPHGYATCEEFERASAPSSEGTWSGSNVDVVSLDQPHHNSKLTPAFTPYSCAPSSSDGFGSGCSTTAGCTDD